MSVTKVTVDGMDLSSDVTLSGTTPTLTIGDAGAEDTKLVFDGNAQDFHIGLDDTADDLVIGLGSALGTTTHMAFTEDGEITKPLQPAFQIRKVSGQTNIAIASVVAIVFDSERFDVGANFASNTFTAPVTGKYYLDCSLYVTSVDSASTYYQVQLITSNRTYYSIYGTIGFDADVSQSLQISHLVDMDASDTASIALYIEGGSAQADISNDATFSGYLSV